MSNNVIRITDKLNVADSNVVASSKAASELKNSVDSLSASKVSKSGDTITGNLVVDSDVTVVGKINATIEGSSESAVSATKDSNGNVIVDTYATKNEVAEKVSTVNGLTPDSSGNVDVGGMPLGTLMPYTGKDVPAGTLRADGTTYTNMQSSFPDFYEWVLASGLTVSLAEYSLVEGSCGYYGLDTSTGTVRMPTLAAGVFGSSVASQYGQAMQAGLPNITGVITYINADATNANSGEYPTRGAFRWGNEAADFKPEMIEGGGSRDLNFDASRSNSIYGNSDTVTPSHVKYPWVIVVYNTAIPASVAEAAEFVNLLDGVVRSVNGVKADTAGNVLDYSEKSISTYGYVRFSNGLQICWGGVKPNYSDYRQQISFPKPFTIKPNVQVTPTGSSDVMTQIKVEDPPTSTGFSAVTITNGTYDSTIGGGWIAFGPWK